MPLTTLISQCNVCLIQPFSGALLFRSGPFFYERIVYATSP